MKNCLFGFGQHNPRKIAQQKTRKSVIHSFSHRNPIKITEVITII